MTNDPEVGLLPRLLGTYGQGRGGPILIVFGGVHGNEPAGVNALRRVLAELDEFRPPFEGRLVALTGNRRALEQRVRYVDRDLNRLWTDAVIEGLAAGLPSSSEERELAEILEVLRPCLEEGEDAPRRVALLDLHSTSADGSPFTIMADTVQNRRLALALPVPVILGLEERIEGTLLSYFSEEGHVAVCLEGGQNEAPSTVDHHQAAIWLAMEAAGLLRGADVPERAAKHELLARAARGLPRVVEIRYRHPIRRDDDFRMDPGYSNFAWVDRGDGLATSSGRRVRTPSSGLLLMPRYQGQGADGFFLGREVRPIWLWLSGWIRCLRLSGLPALLPGVRRDPRRRGLMSVDPRVARWLVVELFHLFGYRRSGREDGRLLFLRRPDAF